MYYAETLETTCVKTILIAEDNKDLRRLFSSIFRKRGYDVYSVENGQQAVDFLTIQLPDLLVLDVNMPELCGLDVLKFVREMTTTKHVQVIIVSGNTMIERIPEAKYADLLLMKPVSTHDLVTLAERLMH